MQSRLAVTSRFDCGSGVPTYRSCTSPDNGPREGTCEIMFSETYGDELAAELNHRRRRADFLARYFSDINLRP